MSNQHEEKNIQYMPMQMVPMTPDDDVIGLLELWRTLIRKKWIILGITLVCTLSGVAYTMLTTPLYETEAHFLPPTFDDIVELNVDGISIINSDKIFTPENV